MGAPAQDLTLLGIVWLSRVESYGIGQRIGNSGRDWVDAALALRFRTERTDSVGRVRKKDVRV
ncbi:MAG: hypothetical protein QOD99_449, partial [Chthoniobacter sp.]|nr:hypothetical protein [Chthoniobacter sp.]